MPDYEIRLFHADGSLALVHVSHHENDEEAHSHARRLLSDLARYELHRGGRKLDSKP
ncbi:MAG: hypothetical protein JSR60_06700 [Proteobacteria bacterium]|nr:hypothetical protein [Pseudomonadota bacterium]